jgi:hypothetical protein
MRGKGITYDTGFRSAGTSTREPFDPEIVRREMRIIREDLHCNAVRVTGGYPERLEVAARHAAEAGLEVWFCPFTNGLTSEELLKLLADCADRAERLRKRGAEVVFLTGSEVSLFTAGFLPGDSLEDRLALLVAPLRLRPLIPEMRARVNEILGKAVEVVRARFGGRLSYASLPFEGVDWGLFDIISTDACYRTAENAARFRDDIRAFVAQGRAQGKPVAITEFGCTTHRGAADSGRGDSIIEWGDGATFGATPFGIGATASSGLAVSFASTTPAVCTVSAATVTLASPGVCTIQATQAGNANWTAATPVNQSFQVAPESQTITFAALSNHVFGSAPFKLNATASSGLAVSFASTTLPVCTVSSGTVTLVNGGTCTIQATQAGNTDWAAAPPVNQSFQVTQASQTITFGILSNHAFGTAPFTVSAPASSGLPVSFASTTSTVCTVSGTSVTLVAVGPCTIQATQAGNADYAAANPVNRSFQVTRGTQTITFGALGNQAFGTAPFAVSATANSGLRVGFNSQNTLVCTVSAGTVTLVAVGTCTIQATQAGNSNWLAATSVNQSFQVTQGSQTITFAALSNRGYGTAPFKVSATASSGLAVSFASTTPAVCTMSGATVTLAALGTCTIQATQAGNSNWAAAPPVNQSFQVIQGSQTITFGTLSNQAFGTAPFTVSATASSGLAVTFSSTTPATCTVSGATVTLVAVGSCTIQAAQAGNVDWAAATPVSRTFQVTRGTQTIAFGALANQTLGSGTLTVSATATSGLAVSFNSQTTKVCKVSGTTVTLNATGTCTIQATQAGNSNWAAATPVNQSFQVIQKK